MKGRAWSEVEERFLRRAFGSKSYDQMAKALNRTRCAVRTRTQRLGLVVRTHWTPEEMLIVERQERAGDTPAQIAAHLPGRSLTAVYQVRVKLGLARQPSRLLTKLDDLIKETHPEGWSDSEIAAEWNRRQQNPAAHITRNCVGKHRRKLGLPDNALSPRRIEQVRQKTREQLRRSGLPTLAALRAKAFRDRARSAGWPEDLRPRHVQILNVIWDKGPMTRREIATAIGARTDYVGKHAIRKILKSNDREGSYLAHLLARGLIIVFERANTVTGKGKGRSTHIYSLPLNIERRKVS